MKYVMIGNSAAAIGCIEGIRETDTEGEILVIAGETDFPYSRPLISYYLAGDVSKEGMAYRTKDFYEKNKAAVIAGKNAAAVDSMKKTVTLDDKTVVSYDKLFVGTGSVPLLPPIPGLKEVKEKFFFQSLSDALALEKAVKGKKRLVILGGGLIGLKCAEGLTGKLDITVVDREDHLLPSILDAESAAAVKEAAEEHGIACVLGENVVAVKEGKLQCESGREIPFDLLVVAVGVLPNTALLKKAGAVLNHGIVVNDKNETSLNGIYAAGDCVEERDVSDGKEKVLALLPNAAIGGRNAGRNMAGEESFYRDAIAVNALKFWDHHLISAGIRVGSEMKEKKEKGYKKLFYADNELKGFIMIDDVASAGIYTALLRNKTKLSDVDFDLLKEKPMLAAFAPSVRKKMLGGQK